MEQGIEWETMLRFTTDNLPHKPQVSDCLDDLLPGDHVEIQWRMSIGLTFEDVMVEFRHYSLQSKWNLEIFSSMAVLMTCLMQLYQTLCPGSLLTYRAFIMYLELYTDGI